MNKLNIKDLLDTVMNCLELHMRSSKDWHYGDPAYESDEVPDVEGPEGLRELVMRQHWLGFRLHHAREEGASQARIDILEGKLERVTRAVDAHMLRLLGATDGEYADLCFGDMMAKMSELSLATYHQSEEARNASSEAAHEPDDRKLARKAEGLMEKVGELNTLRMVQGREMLDAIVCCFDKQSE